MGTFLYKVVPNAVENSVELVHTTLKDLFPLSINHYRQYIPRIVTDLGPSPSPYKSYAEFSKHRLHTHTLLTRFLKIRPTNIRWKVQSGIIRLIPLLGNEFSFPHPSLLRGLT